MEIYLAEIPKSDGHEQHGFRPVILITRPVEQISIIIPLTTNVLALKYPYTLKVEPSIINGLTFPSIVLIFQIRAIDSKRLSKLEEKYVEIIKDNLIKMLKLRLT